MDESNRPLSPELLQTMTESELRLSVLIPLFRKMGFLDVREYHGGPLEQGKDIVMWRRAEFGHENVAVVIKSERITGQAAAGRPASAATVVFQIRQCFGEAYLDGLSPEAREVNTVLVVCPHEIKKEALQSIRSGLDESSRRSVNYLHGDELWKAVRRHLGPRSALAQLGEVGRLLEDTNPNYRIVAKTKGAQVAVSLEAKHPNAHIDEPLEISAQFEFADDETGRAAQARLIDHIETGTPVTLDGQYVKEWNLPPLLRELFGDRVSELSLASKPADRLFALTIELVGATSETVKLPPFDFRCVQSGRREATFVSDRPPLAAQLILREPGHEAVVTISTPMPGANVAIGLEIARARRLMAAGCGIVIRDSNTQLIAVRTSIPPGSIRDYPDWIEELLANAVTIQEATRRPIAIPTRELVVDDFLGARAIAEGVRTGTAPVGIQSASMTVTKPGVERLLSEPTGASLHLAFVADGAAKVLDIEVHLGPIGRIIDGARLGADERARLRGEVDNPATDRFAVTLDCSEAKCKTVYLDYLPREERTRYASIFPGFDRIE